MRACVRVEIPQDFTDEIENSGRDARIWLEFEANVC